MVASTVEIMLLSDGSAAFGVQNLTATVDTTASGVDDVQVVRVVQGPANLYIKTTTFSDGINVWDLGTTSGLNRVVWEFSTTGTAYTTLTAPTSLLPLAAGVPTGGMVSIYFRLTMPSATSSTSQHSAILTIVAVPP